MYVVESKGGAIICMLLSLFFLGTWPAVIASLERRGRLPQHTYLDYTFTNLLAAILIALTFGQIGTTLNYFLDHRINKAEILFPGVGCFLIAVFLGAAVHKSNAADNKAKLKSLPSDLEEDSGNKNQEIPVSDGLSAKKVPMDIEKADETRNPKFGTAKFLIRLEEKRSIKVFGRNIWIGMTITIFAGLCFSLFSPLFNVATNDQFKLLKKGVPHLVVYTAFFYFSVSAFVVAIILNVLFLYHPVLESPKSSFKAYISDWDGRGWALLAGLLCGFGNGLQFMGGQAAGYAAADAVQVSSLSDLASHP
ncbi:hypothetical protein KSS87_005115 [Heliosperma pusillum]|nr:hypothetical protein KSS87_005115 [Heliosperma pusillum]